jgi:Zn-dependent M28 family amino/carboxypeptidase
VHETGLAGYPYSVVKNTFARGNFDLRSARTSTQHPMVASWITLQTAETLFIACGLNFETMKQAALSKTFTPTSLGASVQFHVENGWRDLSSRNVVARIQGSDPKRRDQLVIYSAHWDHFGWDPKLPGGKHDQIYHGAADNASGVAALLELARAFKTLRQPPERSILFIATTGEEEGLLGARYYVEHPLYPLRDTLADINMDVMATWGKTSDVELFGSGKSSLDETVRGAAGRMGLVVSDDSHPERGLVFRADSLEFARAGIPVVYLGAGREVVGKTAGFGGERMDAWIAHDYHQVTDTVRADWDLAGTAQETELLFRVGVAVAEARDRPHWNEKSEFKAMGDSMSQ